MSLFRLLRVLVLLLVAGLLGCGGDSGGFDANARVSVSLSATSNTAAPGSAVTLTATVLGSSKGVSWSTKGGTLSAKTGNQVVWTAPAATGQFKIRATSRESSGSYAETTVSVDQAVAVTISPATVTVTTGAQTTLQAVATGGVTNGVAWSVVGGGTLSATTGSQVTYTAPDVSAVVRVRATSVDDATKYAEGVVTVKAPVQVSVSPAAVTLVVGTTGQFTASVANASDPSVSWATSGGTLSATTGATVSYTAPATPGSYTVTVRSVADPTKAATVVVTVVPSPGVTISPSFKSLLPGQSSDFRATVENVSDGSVVWTVVAGSGTIVANGTTATFTAPPVAGTCTIRATSVADPTKHFDATIDVPSPTQIDLTPPTATCEVNQTLKIAAIVTGGNDGDITWSVASGSGTLSTTSGATTKFTAGMAVGTSVVKATSIADPTKFALIVITVSPATGTLSGTIQ